MLRHRQAAWGQGGARALAIVAVLALWELAARANADSFVLAGPVEVARYLWQNAPLLTRALGATLQSAAWGFVWGNLAAILLAVAVVLIPRAERVVAALALIVFCLPLVATGPILRVLFGQGNGPQITLAALAVYYTTFLPLVVGLRAVPQSWLDLIRSHGRGRMTQLIHVRAPASFPYLIAGLQIAAPAAILGAMVGEFTGAERGLGVLTIRAMRALDVDATWAIATLAAGVSILAYGGFGALVRRLRVESPAVLLTPPDHRHRRPPWRRLADIGVIVAIALVLWQATMDLFDLNPFFAKRPGDVVAFLLTGPDAAAHRATLFAAYGETLVFTLPGYLAGLALGAGLACGVVLMPGLATTALPLSVALRSVPIVATAPLIVLALGRGAVGTITIVTVMIFFPTLVACLQGLRQTPGQIIDIFDTYASGRWRLLRLARVPAMLPAFFASARMAVPAAILAVTTAEWLATGNGIGSLMALTASTSDYNMLWSAIVLVALTAALAYGAVAWIEAQVLAVYAMEQTVRR
ncbi:ABC transporter permease [Oceaniglobus indicus]|uniref:ABC transporter permease n=1 Tax=Oceaniglobus indicus TaxID=2047749 RepID=UPI001F4E179B|nr:ABC transporter permease subunit [Oceaniglobus indicus]